MTIRLPSNEPIAIPQSGIQPRTAEQERARSADAAKQFEAVLLQQLVSVMRQTAPSGGMMGESSGASGQYMAMFDQAIAEHMAAGGGLGLQNTLFRSLGGQEQNEAQTGTLHSLHAARSFGLSTNGLMRQGSVAGMSPFGGSNSISPSPLSPIPNLLPNQRSLSPIGAAASFLSRPEVAGRWARDGQLTRDELASPIATEAANGGIAAFSVEDAAGFQGSYKCNLFALETARRAGYAVPVQAREQGWGYPDPNSLVRDISQDGRLRGDWAHIATGNTPETFNSLLERGGGVMLVGSGSEGRSGHMGVVERIHEIEYAQDGSVRRIVFDGWEARQNGAQHLERRTWNLHGHPGGTNARNGFQRVEILQLKSAPSGERPEVRLSREARASVHVGLASRNAP